MAKKLNIEALILSEWQTNCYVIWVDGEEECWIIDAGFGAEAIVDVVKERGLEPRCLVVTHGHVDHIGGIGVVREAWPGVGIVIHEAEAAFLSDPELNLSAMMGERVIAPDATEIVRHGDKLELSGLVFEVRHAPGHSPGSIVLYEAANGVAIVGDVLFAGSVGRTDFPTSDGFDVLLASIREQVLTLSDETVVLSGHGPGTTVGEEKKSNPFLQQE